MDFFGLPLYEEREKPYATPITPEVRQRYARVVVDSKFIEENRTRSDTFVRCALREGNRRGDCVEGSAVFPNRRK